MKQPVAIAASVIGALALLWLLAFSAMATYHALADGGGMWDMMGDMGDMHGMMGRGNGPETAGLASGDGSVRIVDFAFQPTVLTVTPGTTVTWTNEDSAPHTATGDDFDTGRLDRGDSAKVSFEVAGSFKYICSLHPSMQGRIVVSARG